MIKHFKTPYKSKHTSTPSIRDNALMPTSGLQQSIMARGNTKPKPSQRMTYARAMNSAQHKGGSNGIGVGY